jgi:hypothetical protein
MSPREELNSREIRVATMVWEGKNEPGDCAPSRNQRTGSEDRLRSVFDKLGVWSRLELALYVASHGGAKWEKSLQLGQPSTIGESTVHLSS